MKYFIDTEFLEGTQVSKCPFRYITGKRITKPTIDLISIALVGEDGREYYAISKDFNLEEAWNRYDIKKEWYSIDESNQSTRDVKIYWIRENVLKPIYNELTTFHINNYNTKNIHFGYAVRDYRYLTFTYKNLKWLINNYGKTNKQIAEEVKEFVNIDFKTFCNFNGEVAANILDGKNSKAREIYHALNYDKPKFYGYFADYDWVVFCWLFGNMIDLPKGFPMYCIDLKQHKDYLIEVGGIKGLEKYLDYPKQTNEHNALADARWNRELYKFLESL